MAKTSKLLIAPVGFKAAKFACLNYHYSKSVPAGKLVKFGVWEDNKFIGAVIFSRGANNRIGHPYKLSQTEICELTRVALKEHRAPVTRIIAICLKLLKKTNPGLKLVLSYADIDQDHTGVIYKAGNWLYAGKTLENKADGSKILFGKRVHGRTISSRYGTKNTEWLRKNVDPNVTDHVTKGKHKYLYVLDNSIKNDIINLIA